jgi:hypothetical protein
MSSSTFLRHIASSILCALAVGAALARTIAQQQGLTLKFGVFPWARAQKTAANGSYESLKGKRLVAVLGWVYGTPFDHERANLGVTNAITVESGLTMLLNNRMDFFVANERNATAGVALLG